MNDPIHSRLRDAAARGLRPPRDGLARARALVDTADPRAAWAALVAGGVFPADWLEAPHRRFADEGGALHDHPPTLAACLALASDARGVVAAEALAREALDRWRPWRGPAVETLVWHCAPLPALVPRLLELSESTIFGYAPDRINGLLVEADVGLFPDEGESADDPALRRHRAGEVLARYARLWRAWRAACERGLTVPSHGIEGGPAEGTPFRDLSDPIAPWFDLWDTGYALGSHVKGGVAHLFAPGLAPADDPPAPHRSLAYLRQELGEGRDAPLSWREAFAPDGDVDAALRRAWAAERDPETLVRFVALTADAAALVRGVTELARAMIEGAGGPVPDQFGALGAYASELPTPSREAADALFKTYEAHAPGDWMNGASAAEYSTISCLNAAYNVAVQSGVGGMAPAELADETAQVVEYGAQIIAMAEAGASKVSSRQWAAAKARVAELAREVLPPPDAARLRLGSPPGAA